MYINILFKKTRISKLSSMVWGRGQIMSASDPLCWMKNYYLSVRWTRIDPIIFIPCLPWLIGWIIGILYSTTFQLKKKAKILFSFLKNVGKSAFLGLKKKFQQWKYLHRYLFWITHPTRYQLGALSKREVCTWFCMASKVFVIGSSGRSGS